jgi:choline kinase
MVATLFCALPFFEDTHEDLLIAYGDIVYQRENLEKLLQCSDEICLMIDRQWRRYWEMRLEDPLNDAETLVLDNDGYVVELGKKPEDYQKIQGQYTGLIKIRADRLPALIAFYQAMSRQARYDGKDFDNMYMTSFLQALIDAGWKAKACMVDNGWLEVDTVDDLSLYEDLQRKGELEKFCRLD